MPDADWGVKRGCPSCGTRFYDLARDPATCPACGNSFSLEQLTLKRGRADRPDAKLAAAAAAAARARPDDLEDEEILDTGEDIGVADEILEDDEDTDSVPLEDIGERPAEDPEV
jgi:uncharacterized protein (TIGR02300 family)